MSRLVAAHSAQRVVADECGGGSIAGGLVTSSVPGKRRVADVYLLLHTCAHGQQPQDSGVNQPSRAYLTAVRYGENPQAVGLVGFVIPAEPARSGVGCSGIMW
ncbi:MAG TPA: hypothetical protein VF657_04805 [Actinoplanes sp.]|jgi:hypothetical protein